MSNTNTNRYRVSFSVKPTNGIRNVGVLKAAIFSWIREVHNPEWLVCNFTVESSSIVIFTIESTAEIGLNIHNAAKKIFEEHGFQIISTLVVPSTPAL